MDVQKKLLSTGAWRRSLILLEDLKDFTRCNACLLLLTYELWYFLILMMINDNELREHDNTLLLPYHHHHHHHHHPSIPTGFTVLAPSNHFAVLLLLNQEEGAEANIITYNMLFRFCPWRNAMKLLESQMRQGLQATSITYNSILASPHPRWEGCLQTLVTMLARQLRCTVVSRMHQGVNTKNGARKVCIYCSFSWRHVTAHAKIGACGESHGISGEHQQVT